MSTDVPPSLTIQPIDTPPDSERPTSAMLKADIDSGRTGDKVAVFDPGLSPLGTDDEAAGHPPGPARVALARRLESILRWPSGKASASAHAEDDGFPSVFVGFIGIVALILAGALTVVWS